MNRNGRKVYNRKLRALAGMVLAALALAACGEGNPDTITYRDAENRSLFQLPNDWHLYRADELVQVGSVPFLPDIGGYKPISFVAFDGAAGRNLENLALEVTASPFPLGAQIIRQISPDEKEILSRRMMAMSAYNVQNPGQGVQINTEDFSFGRDYEGIRAFVGFTREDGDLEGLVYVLAVTNPEVTELYSMAAGCSLDCFSRQQERILEAVNSWVVNTRR